MRVYRHKLLAAAALAAAAPAALASAAEITALEPEQALLEQIEQLHVSGRPQTGLIEPLRDLALLYQGQDDHVRAVAALEEARHVARVHWGLSSVDEALLLEQQIHSEKALGLHERAWDLEQDMVTIARQHLDDLRVAPIFRGIGDDRLEALTQYRDGVLPPELYLGCYYAARLPRYDDTRGDRRPAAETGSCSSGSKAGAMSRIRSEILLYYAEAIEAILRNGDYASRELRYLERQALRIGSTISYPVLPSFGNAVTKRGPYKPLRGRCVSETIDDLLAMELLGTCLAPVVHANGVVIANVGSWVSLVRLLSYEARSAAPASVRAETLAELADWILFSTPVGRRPFDDGAALALELYERLHRELRQADDLRPLMTRFFSPAVPVTLPTFAPNPFAVAATEPSESYVDVAFAVSQHGIAERIEIVASENATRAEQRDVIRVIEGVSFRPRVVDGELAASAPIVLRYGLTPRSLQAARDAALPLCERARVCRQ